MCITHPNSSSLLKLQISQLITRTKSCCDIGWNDIYRSTTTPSTCNTEHQSPHAPSTCSSTHKSDLFYPQFKKNIHQKGTGEMKSPPQVSSHTVLLLFSLMDQQTPTTMCRVCNTMRKGSQFPAFPWQLAQTHGHPDLLQD